VREAVIAGEVVVEDQHVGTHAVELAGEIRCARCGGDDRKVGLGIDEPAEAGDNGRRTPVATLLAHVACGAIVGGFASIAG
jgi:hypothetical protein